MVVRCGCRKKYVLTKMTQRRGSTRNCIWIGWKKVRSRSHCDCRFGGILPRARNDCIRHCHDTHSFLRMIHHHHLRKENKQYEKQVELAQKLTDISNDTIIRTKAKANTALADPIAALAGARLLPYQQRLSRICDTLRYYRNILNWNESVLSFWVTLTLFGLAAVSLIVPWGFLLQWTSRFVVWVVSSTE